MSHDAPSLTLAQRLRNCASVPIERASHSVTDYYIGRCQTMMQEAADALEAPVSERAAPLDQIIEAAINMACPVGFVTYLRGLKNATPPTKDTKNNIVDTGRAESASDPERDAIAEAGFRRMVDEPEARCVGFTPSNEAVKSATLHCKAPSGSFPSYSEIRCMADEILRADLERRRAAGEAERPLP